MRILWITSEPEWAKNYAGLLSDTFGAEVFWAESANQAMDLMEGDGSFDLIICGQMIVEGESKPGVDRIFQSGQTTIGFEAIQKAKKTKALPPVMALISIPSTIDEVESMLCAADWTMRCPPEPKIMLQYIAEATGIVPI